MIHPDLIDELEWTQHKTWDSFITLLRARARSMLAENQKLRERVQDLENTAVRASDGQLTRLTTLQRNGAQR